MTEKVVEITDFRAQKAVFGSWKMYSHGRTGRQSIWQLPLCIPVPHGSSQISGKTSPNIVSPGSRGLPIRFN
jgi:hypothetical protein